jgi:lauroyl/myristoyl acyltransferase
VPYKVNEPPKASFASINRAVSPCQSERDGIRTRNTRLYNAMLERLILRHPEQWWWMHRRWKTGTKARR